MKGIKTNGLAMSEVFKNRLLIELACAILCRVHIQWRDSYKREGCYQPASGPCRKEVELSKEWISGRSSRQPAACVHPAKRYSRFKTSKQ